MDECPGNVILDKNFIYYMVGRNIYKRGRNWSESKQELIAKSPVENVSYFRFWIDSKSKNIRISYVDVIPDIDYLPLRKLEPDSTFFKYKGKMRKMFGVVSSPGVAVALEFINGHWKPIVETPVDADACCLFGEQYLSIGPRDGIGHLLDLHSTQIPQKLRPSFLSPRLLKRLKKDGFGEPILLKLKNNKLLITYSGVTPNETTYGFGKRFYLCDIPCVKPQKIADNSDYFVETAFADNHFFILTTHGEYQVFSLDDGKLIMTIKPVNYSQDHGGWTP